MSTITTDVTIIGGGIIGCAIAYYLRKAGIDALVLERDELGGQASGAAAGLLAPLGPLSGPGPFADLLLAGFRLFPTLVPELEEASGLRLNYHQSGALRLIRNPKRLTHLRKRLAAWQPLGLQLHELSGDEARKLEPTLSDEVHAAIYAPEEAQIEAPALLHAFVEAATRLGAHFYPQRTIIQVETTHGRIHTISTAQGERIACNTLVVATGTWVDLCQRWFAVSLPVRPLAGQIIALSQSDPPPKRIIFGDAIYVIPRGNEVIVGATKEETGYTASITPEGTTWLATTAARLVPELARSRVERAWAGLRPHTPDHRPILGPLPGWENVLVAVGHNSVGVMLSGITGQAITEIIIRGTIPDLIRPFSKAFLFKSSV
jgi:glycine oxidase